MSILPARPVPPSRPSRLHRIVVRPRLGAPHFARLFAGTSSIACVMGPAGFTHRKREGDGATPVGRFAIAGGFFRADRLPRPPSTRTMRATRPTDGWCDDSDSPCYNQPVTLPAKARHEAMWRGDRLYDLGLVIDFNRVHPLRGRGSAIFMHVMAPGATPTAGCIALHPQDLRRLLPRLSSRCTISLRRE